jgi:hypothetical protein
MGHSMNPEPKMLVDSKAVSSHRAVPEKDEHRRKPLKLRYASRKPSTTGERIETSSTLTEAEVRSVSCAQDGFSAAMDCVRDGKATLIQFSADEVTAICGDDCRAVQLSEAADIGDWLDALRPIVEAPEHYFTCPVLYFDENRLILAESFESRAIEGLLQYVEEIAEHVETEGWTPLLPPGHYDSYGRDR